ncbi:hypothetical protein BDN70DRAFT_996319 [Pholiota conissans]|uniref:Uncharacterized protein n=1 Tax=Pholiota conissans TaxID=109636 RepID=A0A9P6CWD7_9AGAR|nr:hypothetical protein BDN70DRAFT_996319 [Pholiota conissans]
MPSETYRTSASEESGYTIHYTQFVNEALSRLTNYYIVAERCTVRIQREFPAERANELRLRYNTVLSAFHDDTVNNPSRMPTTLLDGKEFLKKCDDCSVANPNIVPFDECLRMICALNYGAQFIIQHLEGHKDKLKIMKLASERCTKTCHPDVAAKLQGRKKPTHLCEMLEIGQVVWLNVPSGRNKFRLVDHGSTAVKGEFWTFEEVQSQQMVGKKPILFDLSKEDFDEVHEPEQ